MDPEAGNPPKVRALTPEEMRERNKLREAQLGRKTLHVVKIDDQIARERKKAYKESVIDNVKYFAKQYRQVEYEEYYYITKI